MSTEPLVVGAVAYTPNVVPIWEGIRGYFQDSESPDTQMDFVLYSNYARLVDSLIAGHIDIAWNTNLAYVRTVLQTGGRCTPLAQRDTDVDYTTVFVALPAAICTALKTLPESALRSGPPTLRTRPSCRSIICAGRASPSLTCR